MNLSFRGPLSSLISTLLSAAAAVAGLGSLAACNGAVGSGNAPRNVVIAAPSTTVVLPTLHMYQCLTSGLRALLYFTDGSVGDFTARVKWSSSNPGAVQISNGDIAGPGGVGFYANGTLIPGSPGSAVVTADYFGITSQVAIGVDTIGSIQVKVIQNGVYTPLTRFNINSTSATTGMSLAAGTTAQLAATAMLNGVETDVSKLATFGFQNDNPGAATMSNAGLLTASYTGVQSVPLVPVASFAPCDKSNITDPAANGIVVTVRPVQSVAIQPEFPQTDPTNTSLPQLIVGNSEKFTVVATMSNGDTQDVSAQSTLTLAGGQGVIGTFISGANGANNLLSATAVGSEAIFATFTGGNTVFTAPNLTISTAIRQLNQITTCWSDPFTYAFVSIGTCPASQGNASVQAGSLTPVQYHDIGSYESDTGAPITQEITRQTSWTLLNSGIATITAGGINAGQVLGVAQGTTTVEASISTINNNVKIPQLYSPLNVSPLTQQ
jgi:hypothetical protein